MRDFKFNGVSLMDARWSIEAIPETMPARRGSNLVLPSFNGSKYVKKHYEERTEVINMWVRGVDSFGVLPVGKTTAQQLDENIDYLRSLFGISEMVIVQKKMNDDTWRVAQSEVKGAIEFTSKTKNKVFSVELTYPDPFFYGTVEVTEETTAIELTNTWTHVNIGTAPVDKMLVTFTGPLSSPKLENLNNGIWLQYSGAIGAGESVVINTEDFTCLKGATNMISALRHGGDASLMILESGNNSLKLTTDTTGGAVDIEYYPAYF